MRDIPYPPQGVIPCKAPSLAIDRPGYGGNNLWRNKVARCSASVTQARLVNVHGEKRQLYHERSVGSS